jgi:hypothetical protein
MPRNQNDRSAGDWKPIFLANLAGGGNIRGACLAAGIGRSTAYDAKAADEAFADAWEDAEEDAVDAVEAQAWTRALNGDPRMIELVLSGRRRDIYGKNNHTLEGTGGGPVRVTFKMAAPSSDDEDEDDPKGD